MRSDFTEIKDKFERSDLSPRAGAFLNALKKSFQLFLKKLCFGKVF